jgi:hypothetical protein
LKIAGPVSAIVIKSRERLVRADHSPRSTELSELQTTKICSMSAASRESTHVGDTDGESRTQSVIVPVAQRNTGLHSAEDVTELGGGGEYSGKGPTTTQLQLINTPVAASSQRTTRQSDLAPSLAAWDTRTHEPTAEEDDDEHDEHNTDNIAPTAPPDFKPFFALVEDPITGEYHHPEVHYIFADDEDQGVLTSAALRAIDKEDNTLQDGEDADERVAIIDMDSDGRTVLGISSLSPDWQALRTQVWQAPGRSDNKQGTADRGVMLRVSGKETNTTGSGADKQDAEDLDVLVKNFGLALESLDGVLGEEDARGQEEGSNVLRSQRPGSGAD